jgi:hypothetical protein
LSDCPRRIATPPLIEASGKTDNFHIKLNAERNIAMPMIDALIPQGALTAEAETRLLKELGLAAK